MPIVVSKEGWVKIPPKPNTRPSKPVDPVDIFRGPLAYITGRPEFKEPVKKNTVKQLMLEAARIPAPPPPQSPVIFDESPDLIVKPTRSSRTRSRVPSEVVSVKSSRHKPPSGVFEVADEEIVRPELHMIDSQSQRSASPAASRNSRATPSTRSRRHVSSSQPIRDDDQDNYRHNRSGRHASSQSAYSDNRQDDSRSRHRSSRSERSYREPTYRDRSRDRDRYYSHPMSQPSQYPHHYAPQQPVQPIVIYSSPAPAVGCGGHHHSCQSSYQTHQCHTAQPRPVYNIAATTLDLVPATSPAPAPVRAIKAISEPRSAPSEISSVSTGSTRSKAMSYKWYSATQPLIM